MKLIYKNEKPIKPGWYWLKSKLSKIESIALIKEPKDVISVFKEEKHKINEIKGLIFMMAEMPLQWFSLEECWNRYEWAGPIPEPEEKC